MAMQTPSWAPGGKKRRRDTRTKLLAAGVVVMMAVAVAIGVGLMLGIGPTAGPKPTPEITRPPAQSFAPVEPGAVLGASWTCEAHPAPSFALALDEAASSYTVDGSSQGSGNFMHDAAGATISFTSGPLEGAKATYNTDASKPNLRFGTGPVTGFPDASRARCTVTD